MKIRKRLCIALAIVLPAAALIAASGITAVQFSEPVVVAGKAIAPGQYMLRWKTSSPETIVAFDRKGTIVTEARARLVEREKESPHDSTLAVRNAAGELVLKEVRMRGRRQVLVFD